MTNAWPVPTHHLPVNQKDTPITYRRHIRKRYKVSHIRLAEHVGLIWQEDHLRAQGGHFFQRDARIASVTHRRALVRRLKLLPEVCSQWEAALAVRFTLSQPITAAIPPGHPELFRLALDTADAFSPITDEERQELRRRAQGLRPFFELTPA